MRFSLAAVAAFAAVTLAAPVENLTAQLNTALATYNTNFFQCARNNQSPNPFAPNPALTACNYDVIYTYAKAVLDLNDITADQFLAVFTPANLASWSQSGTKPLATPVFGFTTGSGLLFARTKVIPYTQRPAST